MALDTKDKCWVELHVQNAIKEHEKRAYRISLLGIAAVILAMLVIAVIF